MFERGCEEAWASCGCESEARGRCTGVPTEQNLLAECEWRLADVTASVSISADGRSPLKLTAQARRSDQNQAAGIAIAV